MGACEIVNCSSFHRQIGLRRGLVASHFRTIDWFPLIHFSVLLDVCFELLSCWRSHDLRLQQSSRQNSTFSPESLDVLLISFYPVQIQDTLQPHNITERPPCFTVGMNKELMGLADVKTFSIVAFQHAFFCCWLFFHGTHFNSESDTWCEWTLSSACICPEVFIVSFATIQSISLFNLGSIFCLQPCLERFDTISWSLNFQLISATGHSCLKMVLWLFICLRLAVIFVFIASDNNV